MTVQHRRQCWTMLGTLRPGACVWLIAFAMASACTDAAAQQRNNQPATAEQQDDAADRRVESMLQALDPGALNLSGADLDAEVVAGKLILKGNEKDLDVIELLVRMLESTAEQKELRVITVTEKDAKDLANTAGKAIADMLRQPNQRPEDDVVITALSSTILMISALPRDIDYVVKVLQQVDATKDELPPLEQLVFSIKHRRAKDVADQLTDIIKKMQARKGADGGKNEIQIIPNNANNSIMVLAPEAERAKIQQLIDTLDVEPVKGWGEMTLTIFPLQHSKVSDMESIITDLLTTPDGREAAEELIQRMSISKALPSGEVIELPPIDLQKPMRIIADDGTNSLIIAMVEENVKPMGELIRLLDGVPLAAEVSLKLYVMRFADAETVRDLLNEMFEAGGELTEDPDGAGVDAVPEDAIGRALVYNVGLFADMRTNTLIVTGKPEQLDLVTQVIADLDQPATALKFPLRFVDLEHADATNVSEIITELFDKRVESLEATEAGRVALERERVFLSVDIRTNSLIVSASPENLTEIREIATQLDTRPAKLFDQIRIIQLERLVAADIQEKIEALWKRKADLRSQLEMREDTPVIAISERSNALLIASNMSDYEEIVRLVETLEKQPLVDGIELFTLKSADALVLAAMMEQIFEGLTSGSDSFEAPTVMPDPRSNSLIVAGSRDALERAKQLVDRLDVTAGSMTAMFTVYPLKHASAAQLSGRFQELFDAQSEGQDIARTPIVILPDEASNSLVCSASRDDHKIIVDLLALLDKPSQLARHFAIFPLKMARAASVAEELEGLFQSQGEGSSGRADAIATQAYERTNSIIVWASPSQMANIADVIRRLDTAAPTRELMVRVVQLKQALAEDFSELLQNVLVGEGAGDDQDAAVLLTYAKKHADGSEEIKKLLRQDVNIEADPRTNSLMITAPNDSMEMLVEMIREFDAIRPIRSELRLFPLMNADAEAMVEQLDEIFSPEGGDGDTSTTPVFGDTIGDVEVASVGQELRFTADTRTNTLIAAGAEVDLRMVADLVEYLDAQAVESRVVQVYQAKYRNAQDLSAALEDFYSQEQDVLSELTDEQAQARIMERQVSIASVGDNEEGSTSSLIIGTHSRMYQETMGLIRKLDRPEPQVRISVLIAEVTLSDTFEFGMEFAGQELDFTRGAVVGPNGVFDGSDFDFVGGTTLGALASGVGFNFTVTGEDFSFLFHALQLNSRLELLSRPTLVVRNGGEGNITIADQIPIVSGSAVSDSGQVNSQIGREDVGIVLTATPNISPDGYVTIELQQEISTISGENITLTEGVSSPVFSTREITTNVTLRDGETIVIGGLITSRHSEGETKVPLLGDLPYIYPLFRNTNTSETKTELLMIMTVDILRTDEDVRRMSEDQRDAFVLPDRILESPLMEGLRITPDPSLLGPSKPKSAPNRTPPQDAVGTKRYGPKPKVYGPKIAKPKPATRTQKKAVYGPKVARIDDSLE